MEDIEETHVNKMREALKRAGETTIAGRIKAKFDFGKKKQSQERQ